MPDVGRQPVQSWEGGDMPGSAIARSCFRGLRKALHTHFRDESIRKGYEDAREQIVDLLGSQPDVPITQDSLAGFLNGFLLACTQFATVELINQQNDDMFPVIGGVYLLAARAPLSCQPAQLDALKTGFPSTSPRQEVSVVLPIPGVLP